MWDDYDWGFGDSSSSSSDYTIDSSWWNGSANTGSSSSGSGSTWGDIFKGVVGGIFGGGSSNGSSGSGSNIWGQMLAGAISGSGQAKLSEATNNQKGEWDVRTAQEQAKQQRQTVDFTAELKDYYDQKNKAVKRNALDTYGQFSLTDRYAPSMAKVAPVAVPAKPALR